ncbi:catechol 2,3-dioxygenase-like lactoylglutathione lyase family enzyme [Streptomyces sp. TLI_235]|nr:VOC family protein [Streptomyces sp. TLI_235]PBC67656.1 catechol 2,3-dioxygenase-like lactoylglutathione lyase family enzyme [Streptomyces sp. TLI_235]
MAPDTARRKQDTVIVERQAGYRDGTTVMLNTIMYVTLYVTDPDRALDFYTRQLGLEKRIDFPNPDGRFLTVGVPSSSVEIVLWPHAAAAGQPAGALPDTTPGPVFLESDDPWKDFALLRDRGVTFDQPEPVEYPFGVRIEAVDPDGNRISLRQRPRAARADG